MVFELLMISTVTLNPCVDRHIEVIGFKISATNRARSIRIDAGGKGIDVSRAIKIAGGDAMAFGFIGGDEGRYIESRLAREGVAFNFTQSKNSEILFAWLMNIIQYEYKRAYPTLENFLTTIGRRKFLEPLYKELAKTQEGKDFASQIYKQSRDKYHPITYMTIDKILNWQS